MNNKPSSPAKETWSIYIEPAIRLIAGALVLLVSMGFLYMPSLNQLWVGLSVLLFTGLAGSGIAQILIAASRSRFEQNADALGQIGGPGEAADPPMEMLALFHQASHDKLTGLPSRTLLEDRMELEKARADRGGTGFAVLFICLNNFQQISNRLGSLASDKLLLAVARTLTGRLRPTDTVARWGEGEFIVLVPDLVTMEAARHVAEKLLKSARGLFKGSSAEIITYSIGVAVYPNDAENISKLFEKAEHSMQLAKSLGRNDVQYTSEPEGPMIWGT